MTENESQRAARTGEIMKAFAAIVTNGLILLIGSAAKAYRDEIVSTMDPMTRLVINLRPQSADLTDPSDEETDLRVAVHRQVPEEFLSDVRQHVLNLVVCDADFSKQMAKQVTEMLAPGGCWIILNTSSAADLNDQKLLSAYQCLNLGPCLLLVKKAATQSAVRRGGRRARLAGQA